LECGEASVAGMCDACKVLPWFAPEHNQTNFDTITDIGPLNAIWDGFTGLSRRGDIIYLHQRYGDPYAVTRDTIAGRARDQLSDAGCRILDYLSEDSSLHVANCVQ
jgi:hypothetical protein